MRPERNTKAVEEDCGVGDVIHTPRQHALPLAFVVDTDLQRKELRHDVVLKRAFGKCKVAKKENEGKHFDIVGCGGWSWSCNLEVDQNQNVTLLHCAMNM